MKRLQEGEFNHLLNKIQQGKTGIRDALVCLLMHDSAMRIDDALSVQLKHFSPDRTLVRIEGGKWRTDKDQPDTLPVSQRTIEQLEAYLRIRPRRSDGPIILSNNASTMHQQHYRRLLAREGQRWLGKHVHPHMLRHTSISEAALGTKDRPALPLPIVQRFARHRNLATTQQYIHADESWASDMRQWMQA